MKKKTSRMVSKTAITLPPNVSPEEAATAYRDIVERRNSRVFPGPPPQHVITLISQQRQATEPVPRVPPLPQMMSRPAARLYEYLLSQRTIPTYDTMSTDLQMGRETISIAKKELKRLKRWPKAPKLK